MKISVLFLFAALLLAQAMPVALVTGPSNECQTGCCPPKHCGCCAVQSDEKQSEPAAPATDNAPAPKALPFATSLLTRRDPVLADTAWVVWRLRVEPCSAGDIPLSVLHCSFLI